MKAANLFKQKIFLGMNEQHFDHIVLIARFTKTDIEILKIN